jgi:serine O-acetyltransferase
MVGHHNREILFIVALYLHSRANSVFQIDIHPAATLGSGIMIDHGTGVVIGETAKVGNNVSMLHKVTLGGTGIRRHTVRHPQVGDGVLLGAGATLLGPINIGAGANIGACSMVVEDVPSQCVAIGVPARILYRKTSTSSSYVAALTMETNTLFFDI